MSDRDKLIQLFRDLSDAPNKKAKSESFTKLMLKLNKLKGSDINGGV